MAERRPLVLDNGRVRELPVGDTLPGVGGGGSVLSPAQITAWQNNYSPSSWGSGVSILRINSNQFHFLTGLAATSDGHIARILNTGTFPIGLYNQNTDSSAANRFGFDDHDVIILPSQTVALFYDGTAQRWELAESYALNENSPFVSRWWNECFTTAGDSHGASNAMWPTAGGGTYTADIVGAKSEGGRIGVITCTTGTGTTSRVGFYLTNNEAIEYRDSTGVGYQEFRAVVRSPLALSDATTAYLFYAGYLDVDTGEPADGAWLRYTHGDNSGNWQTVTGSSASRTTNNSSTAFAANTWYSLRVVLYPNLTAELYVNGVSMGRNTTDLPVAGRDYSMGCFIRKTAGSGTPAILIDGVGYTIVKYTK